MPSTVPNKSQQRTALDDRGDPVGAIFQVAHHVALQNFGDDLAQLIVPELAIRDGQLDQLGKCPAVVRHELVHGVEAFRLQELNHLVDELGLLLVISRNSTPSRAENP